MQYRKFGTSMTLAAIALGVVGLFAGDAFGQITVTSPLNNSTIAMPAQLTASVAGCAGSSDITLFEYSFNSSPFQTPSQNNGLSSTISTTDYRLTSQPSPGTQYTIRFKAWSTAGACAEVDIVTHVVGPTTYTLSNVDDVANAAGWNPPNPCPAAQKSTYGLTGWVWMWDAGTADCTEADSTTYLVGATGEPAGPNIDGQSRLAYSDWKAAVKGGNPGERYSQTYGNSTTATNFVYDAYLYFVDPINVQNVEMDNNQADASGNVYIFGVQCAGPPNSGTPAGDHWQYTTNNAVTGDTWNASDLTCNPQSWAANTWHHVQIAVSRGTGVVSYDSVTFDGLTQNFNVSNVDSYFTGLDWAEGTLLLNLQLDGIYNGGSEATITAYIDGMTMIWWEAP